MDSGELKDGTKHRGRRGTAFSQKAVLASTNGVISTLKKQKADFMLFQEIDTNLTVMRYRVDNGKLPYVSL